MTDPNDCRRADVTVESEEGVFTMRYFGHLAASEAEAIAAFRAEEVAYLAKHGTGHERPAVILSVVLS